MGTIKNDISGIYVITNKVNGHYYGGSSILIYKRFREHQLNAIKNRGHSIKLYAAMVKYGVDNFILSIYKECPINELLIEEQKWLDLFFNESICYNIAKNSSSPMLGRKQSSDHIAKRVLGVAGKPGHMLGKKNPGKSLSAMGIPRTKETKEKISNANKGNSPWCKGLKIGKASPDRVRKLVLSHLKTPYKNNKIKTPLGEVVEIFNLSEFCRLNFLSQGNMAQVMRGLRKQHKGYRLHE